MTVEDGFPQRLTAIDDLTRGGHWYLRRTDVCRYLGAYAAGKGVPHSATNRLILDFKMSVSRARRNRPRKDKAIAGPAADAVAAFSGHRRGGAVPGAAAACT